MTFDLLTLTNTEAQPQPLILNPTPNHNSNPKPNTNPNTNSNPDTNPNPNPSSNPNTRDHCHLWALSKSEVHLSFSLWVSYAHSVTDTMLQALLLLVVNITLFYGQHYNSSMWGLFAMFVGPLGQSYLGTIWHYYVGTIKQYLGRTALNYRSRGRFTLMNKTLIESCKQENGWQHGMKAMAIIPTKCHLTIQRWNKSKLKSRL